MNCVSFFEISCLIMSYFNQSEFWLVKDRKQNERQLKEKKNNSLNLNLGK